MALGGYPALLSADYMPVLLHSSLGITLMVILCSCWWLETRFTLAFAT